nr:transcription initiation factor TFIID subunit 4-like [Aegilops tauschii subsp. strangulata]
MQNPGAPADQRSAGTTASKSPATPGRRHPPRRPGQRRSRRPRTGTTAACTRRSAAESPAPATACRGPPPRALSGLPRTPGETVVAPKPAPARPASSAPPTAATIRPRQIQRAVGEEVPPQPTPTGLCPAAARRRDRGMDKDAAALGFPRSLRSGDSGGVG